MQDTLENRVAGEVWEQQLDDAIQALSDQIIRVRRWLHMHPEPSGEEYATTRYLRDLLTEAGYVVRLGPGDRGVIADPPDAGDGPLIALRADIDALRIQDLKTVDYRSQVPNVMHACGHDGHAATLYGVLAALQSVRAQLPWPVRWRGIFQPAEETATGALAMLSAGALDGAEAVLALHLDPSRAAGCFGLRYGALTAACDSLTVQIYGRGGHAARPHESIDPIAAAAQLISSIYLFIPRGTESHDPVVVTIGQIMAGDNANVIPETALLRGTIRSLTRTTRDRIKQHIRQLARGIAEASGARIEVEFEPGPEAVYNDATHVDLLKQAITDCRGAQAVEFISRPSMGGEDFAFYLEQVPGALVRVGCAWEDTLLTPLHSALFDIDERALLYGARVLAQCVALWPDPQKGWRRNTP